MRRKRKERFNEYVSGSGSVDSTEAGRLTGGPDALDHKSIIEELRMQHGTGLLCLHFHDQLCMVLPGPASFLCLPPMLGRWPVQQREISNAWSADGHTPNGWQTSLAEGGRRTSSMPKKSGEREAWRDGEERGRSARDRRERGDPAGDPGTAIAVAPH